jgi:hypothetical protein
VCHEFPSPSLNGRHLWQMPRPSCPL